MKRSAAQMRVLALLPFADWTVGNIRIRDPLQTLSKLSDVTLQVSAFGEQTEGDIAWADIVLLQRESNPAVLSLLEKLQRAGKGVVLDMDDLLTEVPSFLSVHEHCLAHRPYLQNALRSVHAVTVTTPRLQREMLAYNRNVFVVPNCTNESFHSPVVHTDEEPVRLVIASSDTVRVDFIVSALAAVMADPSLRVELVGIGPPGDYVAQSGLSIQRHPIMPHADFKTFIASLPNAIGVIPLDDSRFSNCKSAVKFLDYALAGIPAICSSVPPYTDTVLDGVTGVLCENTETNWTAALSKLVSDTSRRRDVSERAHAFARNNYPLERAARRWGEVLRRVTDGHGSRLAGRGVHDLSSVSS